MKKIIVAILSLALLLSTTYLAAIPTAAASKVALPASSSILVDGVQTSFQAYSVGTSNYFKLRDIAMVLSGTGKQVAVDYDNTANAILLRTGQPYIPAGDELTFSGNTGKVYAEVSSQQVILDATPVTLGAYVIGGYNYFKLRDLGTAINFYVGWDGPTNTITIDSKHEYNVGFFDSTIDYATQKRYEIGYVTQGMSNSYDALHAVFGKWAARLNCNYSAYFSSEDINKVIGKIETYAADGYDGLLVDIFNPNYARVKEVLNELKMPWMACAVAPYTYNYDGTRTQLYPAIEMDNNKAGVQMAAWLIDYAKKTWPGATAGNTGMISLDYSLVKEYHKRTTGAQSVWNAAYPAYKSNFFVADDPNHQMTEVTAYNLTAAVVAAHPKIEYWLICACFEEYGEGAARAVTEKGLDTVSAVASYGRPIAGDMSKRGSAVGSNLIYDWDHASDSCWKATLYTSAALNAEPMICGLYAMMSGRATPETLFLSWINKKAGNKYATMPTPTFMLTKDNYKEYLEWIDAYTGFNEFSYAYQGAQFSQRVIPPASYNS